jgi:hypothetical protein
MLAAVEVNVVLWIMIACLVREAFGLAGYLF